MAQTYSSFRADAALKIIYDGVEYAANRQIGTLGAILRFGTKDYKSDGKNMTFLLDSGGNGSAGLPSNAGSVAHIGNGAGIRNQVSLAYSPWAIRATATAAEIDSWRKGGSEAMFYDIAGRRIIEATQNSMDILDRVHMADAGDGRFTAVTATTSAIAAGASGTITVSQKQQLVRGNTVVAVRGGAPGTGTTVSGVILRVDITNGRGAGTVTVTNVGGSSYTPTSGDFICLEEYDQAEFASILESVDDQAYPVRGTNTTPIDNGDYKSQVLTAGDDKLTVAKFAATWDYLKSTGIGSDPVQQTELTGLWSLTTVVVMPYELRTQLESEFYARSAYTVAVQPDPGWGEVKLINGVPVAATGTCPADTVLFLHTPGFIGDIHSPMLLPGGEYGPFRRMDGTINYEAVWFAQMGFYVKNRRSQAKITNVKGFTLTDAGLAVA